MGLKLFGREIIFEEFQPIWSRYLNVTDRQTDGQTTCNLIMVMYGQSQIRSISCLMGSHSVTFHSTQVNTPRQTGRYSISLLCKDGRLSWP